MHHHQQQQRTSAYCTGPYTAISSDRRAAVMASGRPSMCSARSIAAERLFVECGCGNVDVCCFVCARARTQQVVCLHARAKKQGGSTTAAARVVVQRRARGKAQARESAIRQPSRPILVNEGARPGSWARNWPRIFHVGQKNTPRQTYGERGPTRGPLGVQPRPISCYAAYHWESPWR